MISRVVPLALILISAACGDAPTRPTPTISSPSPTPSLGDALAIYCPVEADLLEYMTSLSLFESASDADQPMIERFGHELEEASALLEATGEPLLARAITRMAEALHDWSVAITIRDYDEESAAKQTLIDTLSEDVPRDLCN